MSSSGVETIDPRMFDVLIVDEFHHAAAPSYDALPSHFQPAELLAAKNR